MFGIGGPELAVILVVALIFVGPEKLPKVARSIGAGLRDLRRVANLAQAELKETVDDLIREADIEDEAHERDKATRKGKATAGAPSATSELASRADAAPRSVEPDSPTPAGRRPDPADAPAGAEPATGDGPADVAAAASAAVERGASDAPRDFADLFVERANAWQSESDSRQRDGEPRRADWEMVDEPAPFEMDLPGVRFDAPPAGVAGTRARRGAPLRAGSPAATEAQQASASEPTDIDAGPTDHKEDPA